MSSGRSRHYRTTAKGGLTERQREVAALIAAGKTNPEIATALGISIDGAKFHVREILSRLELDSREDVAHWWRAERSIRGRALSLFVLPGAGWTKLVAGIGAGSVGIAAAVAGVVMARDVYSDEKPANPQEQQAISSPQAVARVTATPSVPLSALQDIPESVREEVQARADFGGDYIDLEVSPNVYVVQVAGDRAEMERLLAPYRDGPRGIRVDRVARSYAELRQLQERIAADWEAWGRDGFAIVGIGVDPLSNLVRVGILDPTPEKEAILQARYGDALFIEDEELAYNLIYLGPEPDISGEWYQPNTPSRWRMRAITAFSKGYAPNLAADREFAGVYIDRTGLPVLVQMTTGDVAEAEARFAPYESEYLEIRVEAARYTDNDLKLCAWNIMNDYDSLLADGIEVTNLRIDWQSNRLVTRVFALTPEKAASLNARYGDCLTFQTAVDHGTPNFYSPALTPREAFENP